MPDPIQLDDGLFLIDLMFQNTPGVIASYLLAGPGDDLALIEVGPGSTMPALLEGVRAAGYDPEAITKLIVTAYPPGPRRRGGLAHRAPAARRALRA